MKFLILLSTLFIVSQLECSVSFKKKLFYEFTLEFIVLKDKLFKKTKENSWHNNIDDNIVLSALPLTEHKEFFLDYCKSINKKLAILSMVELFEMEPGWINIPVSPSDWHESKTKQLIIQTPDFETPSLEKIKQAVEFLSINEKNNYLTIVHCKAGKGRSATVVVCKKITEAAKNNSLNLDEINNNRTKDTVINFVNLVRKQRPTIRINKEQINGISEYIKYLKTDDGKAWFSKI